MGSPSLCCTSVACSCGVKQCQDNTQSSLTAHSINVVLAVTAYLIALELLHRALTGSRGSKGGTTS